jgi:hypothetical protein
MTRRSNRTAFPLRALALACAAGCGGGSGGAQEPPDVVAPHVAIAFPPADAVTDRGTIVVDGTAGDDVGVAGVTVNGVEATSDDGFRTWRAEVPLALGANGLAAEARDAAGNRASDAGAIDRTGPALVNPTGIALDAARGRALVVARNRLLSVDLASGERAEIALTGEPLEQADRIAVDEGLRVAYVGGGDRIYRVDLENGATVVLSGGGYGAGIDFGKIGGLRVDPATGNLFANDILTAFTCRVDLATGNRIQIPASPRTRDFALDLSRNSILSATLTNGWMVVAWDMGTVAITELSGQSVGAGPNPATFGVINFQGLAYDDATRTFWAVGEEQPVVFEWDLASGDRRLLSGAGAGGGPDMLQPRAMALDAPRGRLLVADAGLDAVVAVDLATGDRSVMSGIVRGAGPSVFGVRDMAAAPDGRLFVLRSVATPTAVGFYPLVTHRDEILVLEGASRTPVPAIEGASLVAPRSIAFDEGADRIVVSDAGGGVFAFDPSTGAWLYEEGDPALLGVDPVTGAATVISDATHGSGPMFVDPDRIAHDSSGILVMDVASKAVFRVDLATGDRAIVSSRLVGSGAEFQTLTALDVDLAADRAIVNDTFAGLLSVDPATGDRTGVASPKAGYADLTIDVLGRRGFLAGNTTLLRIDLDAGITSTVSGGGPALTTVRTVLYDTARDVVLAGDPGTASIVAVSPRTGERVIVAK